MAEMDPGLRWGDEKGDEATCGTATLAGLALGLRLPSDQNLAPGRNISRDEALRARGKELVKARLQN